MATIIHTVDTANFPFQQPFPATLGINRCSITYLITQQVTHRQAIPLPEKKGAILNALEAEQTDIIKINARPDRSIIINLSDYCD
ncbi:MULTISPECIES: hypothetical protein [Methylobacter]